MLGAIKPHFISAIGLGSKDGGKYAQVFQDENSSTGEPFQLAKRRRGDLVHLLMGSCIVFIMLFALFGVTGALIALIFRHNAAKTNETKNTHASFLPTIPLDTPVEFQPEYRYWNMSDFSSEQSWRVLGLRGGIFIKNPEQYGLSPGIEGKGDYEQYPISVFHQLHCLRMLREHFVALLHGHEKQDAVDNHPDHCFDYLRQAIMCAADFSLEKARIEPDGSRRATDGWGTTHHCKSWSSVQDIHGEYRWKYAF